VLDTQLRSHLQDGALAFELHVENRGDEPVDLSFPTAQRSRVALYPADSDDDTDPVWRSDAEKMFAQVLGSETGEPGETVSFAAAWDDPEPGEYRAVGEVVCDDRELRAEDTVLV